MEPCTHGLRKFRKTHEKDQTPGQERTGIDIHFDYSGTFSHTKSHFERSVAIYGWVTYCWISKTPLGRTAKRQGLVKCVRASPALSLLTRTACTELLITPGIRLCKEQSMCLEESSSHLELVLLYKTSGTGWNSYCSAAGMFSLFIVRGVKLPKLPTKISVNSTRCSLSL